MHLRRAILLFAIVLGFAAIGSSLAPPPDGEPGETAPSPTAPRDREPARKPVRLMLDAAGDPERRRIEAGRRVELTVAVEEPGDVAIEELGRLRPADPLAPAMFELLLEEPGRYEVTFDPLSDGPERLVARLEVAPRRP